MGRVSVSMIMVNKSNESIRHDREVIPRGGTADFHHENTAHGDLHKFVAYLIDQSNTHVDHIIRGLEDRDFVFIRRLLD